MPLQYSLDELRDQVQRGILIIRRAVAFPLRMRLRCHVIFETFLSTPIAEAMGYGNPHASAEQQRILSSIAYLVDHLAQVPVLVIPCISPRLEGLPLVLQHAVSGSILPATWNFMLAARVRGLGTCWTIFHLYFEEEAAKILGIPHADVAQVALIPVAYTLGTDFKPGPRRPLASMIHWDAW